MTVLTQQEFAMKNLPGPSNACAPFGATPIQRKGQGTRMMWNKLLLQASMC